MLFFSSSPLLRGGLLCTALVSTLVGALGCHRHRASTAPVLVAAARDFHCPPDEITAEAKDEYGSAYRVTGCNHDAQYVCTSSIGAGDANVCSVFGIVTVYGTATSTFQYVPPPGPRPPLPTPSTVSTAESK